jgi:predicted acyltransferase
MLLGLAAGRWLIESPSKIPFRRFLVAGTALAVGGILLHVLGINPIVKRIWTPAWTLFSGGLCFYLLAAFSWLIDMRGHRRLAFPLVVIGMNSIAAYLIASVGGLRRILRSFGRSRALLGAISGPSCSVDHC